MSVDVHTLVYAALALTYVEAALQSLSQRKCHIALREGVVACLYAALALILGV